MIAVSQANCGQGEKSGRWIATEEQKSVAEEVQTKKKLPILRYRVQEIR